MKMYILILDDVPDSFAPVVAAHASLMGHLEWNEKNKGYDAWLTNSFKKCIVRVSKGEFEKAKSFEDSLVVRENNLAREVAIVLCPRQDYPKGVKFYKLWKPKCDGS